MKGAILCQRTVNQIIKKLEWKNVMDKFQSQEKIKIRIKMQSINQ